MALRYSNLNSVGTIVRLETSVWRARMQITAEDLGLEDSKAVKKALSLGCHRLAPKEALEEIWETVRLIERTLDENSLPYRRGERFVPNEKLPDVLKKLEASKADFDKRVSEFMDQFSKVKTKMFPVIKTALREASKDEVAAERAYARVVANYPSAATVREKFNIRWTPYAMVSPEIEAATKIEASNVKSMIKTMMGGLREELTDRLKELSDITVKGGKINLRSIESVEAVLDRCAQLNILGDIGLERQIRAARELLTNVNRFKVEDGFVAGLEQVQKALQKDVDDAVVAAEQKLTSFGKRKLG